MPVLKELERNIEQRLVTWLKRHGVPHLKLNVMYSRGWPDRCVFVPGGRPFLCEFKRPGETLTPLQEEVHAQLKALGYDVETHWSSETAVEAVAERLQKYRDLEAGNIDAVQDFYLRRLGASRIPEAGGPVAPDPPRRRALPRPRAR